LNELKRETMNSPQRSSHQQQSASEDSTRVCFSANHNYFIHDVQYDFYGKRMATCSSDNSIRVWDTQHGGWQCTYDWKAHNGPVLKVQWAHPEFGQVLASCSEDHTCNIWEETLDEKQQQQQHSSSSSSTTGDSHLTTSANTPSSTSSSSSSSSKRKLKWTLKSTLVDSPQAIVDIKFAPKHHGLKLATSSLDKHVRIYEAPDVMNLSYWTVNQEIDLSKKGTVARCLSWNPSRLEGPALVLGEGNSVNIYHIKERHWRMCLSLGEHKQAVNDVSWAPNMGRSYHLIASASKDGTAQIWKIKTEANNYELIERWVLDDHKAEVWKVEWNITGTVLATSGDDGMVRLFSWIGGAWKCTSTMNAQLPAER